MAGTRATYVQLWRNKPFRALLMAHFTSNFGDWLAFIALFNLAAIEWQTDILGIGFITVAYLLPFVVIAPVAGVFVDRWELRRLMIASDMLRAGVVLLMILADQLSQICVLIFLHQSVSTFFNPAQQAAIPRLVQREEILAANALSTQASHLTKVLGPAVAGMLVVLLGTRGCLVLDAGTFLLSGILLLVLPKLMPHRSPKMRPSVRGEIHDAVRCLQRRKRLHWSLLSLSLAICGLGAFLVALPIHARDALALGPQGMGLLLSMLGVGTVLGAALLMSRLAHLDRLAMMTIGSLILALSLVGLVALPQAMLSAAMILILGVAIALLIVPAHAVFQEETDEHQRGGVISIALAILALAQVSGMGLAAALGQTQPASHALALAAGLSGLAALLLVSGRRLQDLRQQTPSQIRPKADPAIHAGDRG